MPIYVVCSNCKSAQNLKHKQCGNCQKSLPMKERTYKVIVKHNGETVTKQIPFNLELAKRIEAKIKSELIGETYYDRRSIKYSLGDAAKRYFEEYKLRGKDWKRTWSLYSYLLKKRFGDKKLHQIAPFDIEKLKIEMGKTTTRFGNPYTPKSIRNAMELMSRIFNYAQRMNLYNGKNPVKQVNKPKVNNEVINVLNKEEINRLLQILEEYPDKDIANIVKLALFTGLRRGEIFKLRWEDVDLNSKWLYIKNPKGGKNEVIPLNNTALSCLNEQKQLTEESELVFPGKGDKQRYDIKKPWSRIKNLAELPDDFRFHDLRHTYASMLASSGKVDIYTLQRLLTHKSPQMTQRYAHLIEERLREGAEVMDEVVGMGGLN